MRAVRRRAGRQGRGRGATGAALIEALVAVAVVGIALLFLVALLAHEARLTARAAGQHDAVVLLEGAIEGIRAGALPLENRRYTESAPPWLPMPPGRGATVWVEVDPVDAPDLFEVTVDVRYRAGRDILRRSLTTRVWKP
jgi:hypothetical protein